MPANHKVKSLPRQDLEYLDEFFHKVQSSGAQLCEVIEPPPNTRAPQFALRCLPRFLVLGGMFARRAPGALLFY